VGREGAGRECVEGVVEGGSRLGEQERGAEEVVRMQIVEGDIETWSGVGVGGGALTLTLKHCLSPVGEREKKGV
jgi:hypothetical protein